MNFRNTEGQVARWIQRLNEYYFDIRHRKAPRMEMLMLFQEDHAQKIVVIVPEDGVLYRKFESEDGKTFRWQLVLPRSRIPEVLKELHGSPTGARKGPKIRSRGKLHRYNVGAPFERIAFDILGPLPRTASGNKYLLVVMDYFTKWPEVYPIPDQEAPTVAEAVVQHWISRYGVPLQLHSDQGRNFVSANQQDWDQKVPLFLLAYRSAVHETTGYSPSQMLFGRDLRLPCDLLFGRPPDTPSSPETCRISRHVLKMYTIWLENGST
ncbi:retrovirus-related Pol polyprotein from transposon 412 [Trichonephila clavipes]|nr:retrovirus-related Pol polyprotein from transposon 412 [Trichonephila clavipes]